MYPCVENHMAHIAGWTVVVFKDAIDGTWHAMSIRAILHTIPEFREANKREDIPTICCFNDHCDRDEAFRDICAQIRDWTNEHAS